MTPKQRKWPGYPPPPQKKRLDGVIFFAALDDFFFTAISYECCTSHRRGQKGERRKKVRFLAFEVYNLQKKIEI